MFQTVTRLTARKSSIFVTFELQNSETNFFFCDVFNFWFKLKGTGISCTKKYQRWNKENGGKKRREKKKRRVKQREYRVHNACETPKSWSQPIRLHLRKEFLEEYSLTRPWLATTNPSGFHKFPEYLRNMEEKHNVEKSLENEYKNTTPVIMFGYILKTQDTIRIQYITRWAASFLYSSNNNNICNIIIKLSKVNPPPPMRVLYACSNSIAWKGSRCPLRLYYNNRH